MHSSHDRHHGRLVPLLQFGDGHLGGPVQIAARIVGNKVKDGKDAHFFEGIGPRFFLPDRAAVATAPGAGRTAKHLWAVLPSSARLFNGPVTRC